MEKVEKIALDKLKEHLQSAKKRFHEENEDRMKHERIFLLSDLNKALEVLQAIELNNPLLYKQQ